MKNEKSKIGPYKFLGASITSLQIFGRKHYVPTNFWAQTLGPYKFLGANISSLRIFGRKH